MHMARPGLNPGPLADRASTRTTGLPSHTVDLWQFPPAWLDSSPNLLGTMPEPTRQSLCCSQPEHGPTLSHQISQRRKMHMAWPELEPRTSRRPCEHSDYWATEPHDRPVTIFPCLIRFVPESARNHARTDETVPLLLAARARTNTEPPNVTEEEEAHGLTGTRTQDLSQTVRALWPLSYRAPRSTCDINNINKRRQTVRVGSDSAGIYPYGLDLNYPYGPGQTRLGTIFSKSKTDWSMWHESPRILVSIL